MVFLFLLTFIWHNFRWYESCQKWKKEKECPCVLHADSRHYPDLCPVLSLHAAPHLHAFLWSLWGISSSSVLFTSSSFPPKAGGTQAGWLPEGPPLCLGPALQDSLDSESPMSWDKAHMLGLLPWSSLSVSLDPINSTFNLHPSLLYPTQAGPKLARRSCPKNSISPAAFLVWATYCILCPLLLLNLYSCSGSLVSWKPESGAFTFVWDASFIILPWPKTSYHT